MQELQDSFTGARKVSLSLDDNNLLDFDHPVKARMEFQVPRHFSGDEVMEGSLADYVIWNRFLAYNVDPERKLTLKLAGPFTSQHKYRIHLPSVFRFDALPHNQVVKSRWGRFKVDVAPQDNPRELEVTLDMRLENDRVEPKDFAEFQTFHDDVSRAYRVWLNFKPKPRPGRHSSPGHDSDAGSRLRSSDRADPGALESHAGRTDDARLADFTRRLIYHPRDGVLGTCGFVPVPTCPRRNGAIASSSPCSQATPAM